MAFKSAFFNSLNGDRKYSAAELAEQLGSLMGSGIRNGGTNLKVSASGTNFFVSIAPGKAWIEGYYCNNKDTPVELAVNPATGTRRYDRVVLRLDLSISERRIYPYVKQGTSANPPALDRDLGGGVWELSLARIEVTPGSTAIMQHQVIDERLNTEVCGIANSEIGADTTAIFNEFYNYYVARRNEFDTELEAMGDAWNMWFGASATTGIRGEWNAWFNQVKGNLGQVNVFDFDNWARMPGFAYNTQFLANGNITETIKNALTSVIYSTRITVFNADGSVTQTVSAPSILERDVQSKIVFNADGSITQTVVNL